MSDLARTLEGLNTHLKFAAKAIEDGWNSRDERARGFHISAALATIANIERENEYLIDGLYKEAGLKNKAEKAKGVAK